MLWSRHIMSMQMSAAKASDGADCAGSIRGEMSWPQSESRPTEVTAPQQAGLRIAVAEDESELRCFFAKVLPHLGYDVIAVTASGEELVHACEQCRPDVVICDVQLDHLSGPEAVGVIRQRYWVAAIYVAENPVEDTIAVQESHAVVLAKPFRMAELPPAIEQAIELCPNT